MRKASDIHPMERDAFGCVFRVLKQDGKTLKELSEFIRKGGIDLSPSTIREWINESAKGNSAVTPVNVPSLPRKLTPEIERLIIGWVIDCSLSNQAVEIPDAISYVKENFNIAVGRTLISDLFKRSGLTNRTARTSSKGFRFNVSRLHEIAMNWLESITLPMNPSKLCSIGFTFTGHRTTKRGMFSQEECHSSTIGEKVTPYTNCIITCIWADGINRTPAMLFTMNQSFRLDRSDTPTHRSEKDHLISKAKEYDIDLERVVYVGKKRGELRHYTLESSDLLRRFFDRYKIDSNCTVLSGQGSSFKVRGQDALLIGGFKEHLIYPPELNQCLSPNENGLYGPAKQAWRSLRVDRKDDVSASLYLLSQLDRFSKESEDYFSRNLQYMVRKPTMEGVKEVITSTPGKMSVFHDTCLEEYRIYVGSDGNGTVPAASRRLESLLDGKEWGY